MRTSRSFIRMRAWVASPRDFTHGTGRGTAGRLGPQAAEGAAERVDRSVVDGSQRRPGPHLCRAADRGPRPLKPGPSAPCRQRGPRGSATRGTGPASLAAGRLPAPKTCSDDCHAPRSPRPDAESRPRGRPYGVHPAAALDRAEEAQQVLVHLGGTLHLHQVARARYEHE